MKVFWWLLVLVHVMHRIVSGSLRYYMAAYDGSGLMIPQFVGCIEPVVVARKNM
jgi:hypothetical protein